VLFGNRRYSGVASDYSVWGAAFKSFPVEVSMRSACVGAMNYQVIGSVCRKEGCMGLRFRGGAKVGIAEWAG